ncbi:MAG TPA: response regulator [Nitrospira sp.]
MGIRILVADDDPDIVLSLSERLRWLGHEVVTASDGPGALTAIESHALDLALLDISMPLLNGIEVLKRIKQRWPELPVVMLTAYGTIRLAVEAMREGAVDFISKPFAHGKIDRVVAEVLGGTEQRVDMTKLMGEVTHDVKNLLMPLVTGTDLLAEEIDDLFRNLSATESAKAEPNHQVCEEVIQLLRNTSRRIQDRMKQIADYAAVSHAPRQFEVCRIVKIAEAVLKALRVLAAQRHVTLRLDGLDSLPDIVGDENRLYSLFYNLVHNAIPEVPEGGSVTIGGRHLEAERAVELIVQDTVKGMAPDVRDRFLTNRQVSRKAGGTGLGTRIVKDVVDAHGGQIRVESLEGQGTTFVIRLPICQGTFFQPLKSIAEAIPEHQV